MRVASQREAAQQPHHKVRISWSRTAASADWLMAELLKIAKSSTNENVKLIAIEDALDRAGLGAKQLIDIEVAQKWEGTFEGVEAVEMG